VGCHRWTRGRQRFTCIWAASTEMEPCWPPQQGREAPRQDWRRVPGRRMACKSDRRHTLPRLRGEGAGAVLGCHELFGAGAGHQVGPLPRRGIKVVLSALAKRA